MRKIVFYTESKWAFGSIHYSLSKRLFQYGFDCEVLDFFQPHTAEHLASIAANTCYFVTTPVGAHWLMNMHIDPQQIKAVAHAQWDLLLTNHHAGVGFYDQLNDFAVVSPILKQKSAEFGITKVPKVIPIGIDFHKFYTKSADKLRNVGYAGAYSSNNFYGVEIKRGKLVTEATEKAGLPLLMPANQMHYTGMPCFYRRVGCVVSSSLEEGAGLPMLEAGAAGRLCLGTPVGYFEENSKDGRGGVALSLEPDKFVDDLSKALRYFSEDNDRYRKQCQRTQEYARCYDWQNYIEQWVEFLNL